jgi:hypothetical protein
VNFKQFETAKGLILDLLGLGMTPEDLVDIPISKRLVVYCLRELKMRLPANVTVDDIIPYGPPSELTEDAEMSDPSPLPSPPGEQIASSPGEPSLNDRMQGIESALSDDSIRSSSPERSSPVLRSTASDSLSKLNPHAEPFTPYLPLRTTTGPSLFAMALPHQQILPPRPSSPIDLPSSLPPSLPARPTLGYKSTMTSPIRSSVPDAVFTPPAAESSSTPVETEVVDSKPIEKVESSTEAEQERVRLQRLEQKARMELLRRKLELKKKRTDGGGLSANTTPTLPTETPVGSNTNGNMMDTRADTDSPRTILGGQRVASPPPMDLDVQISTHSETPALIAPSAARLRPTTRAMTSKEGTRPSTPSESGPKRGIKRPKAEDFDRDFDQDLPLKRAARIGGAPPPVKRSSFAILNSAPPERHVITWVDDENLEYEKTWNRPQEASSSTNNGMHDVDAVQFAAAAIALGLPITAEELEAARLQEEERKVQREAKAIKLLQTQARLKKLELKKAEKKLHAMGPSMPEVGMPSVASVFSSWKLTMIRPLWLRRWSNA